MERKTREHTVNFTDVKNYLEMHAVIRDSLKFPAYYGDNWDAFWDCITDVAGTPIHIQVLGLENIKKRFGDEADIFLDLLRDFKHYENDAYADITLIEIVDQKTGKTTVLD